MRSNLEMIRELDWTFSHKPNKRGVVTMKEIYLINAKLCLDEMDKIQLFNLRDMVVMWYAAKVDNISENNFDKCLVLMDRMSAITSVIDLKLRNIEEEVIDD